MRRVTVPALISCIALISGCGSLDIKTADTSYVGNAPNYAKASFLANNANDFKLGIDGDISAFHGEMCVIFNDSLKPIQDELADICTNIHGTYESFTINSKKLGTSCSLFGEVQFATMANYELMRSNNRCSTVYLGELSILQNNGMHKLEGKSDKWFFELDQLGIPLSDAEIKKADQHRAVLAKQREERQREALIAKQKQEIIDQALAAARAPWEEKVRTFTQKYKIMQPQPRICKLDPKKDSIAYMGYLMREFPTGYLYERVMTIDYSDTPKIIAPFTRSIESDVKSGWFGC